jgi:hypothetical protein
METLFYLTDVNGPRLTNSPGHLAAARWAVDRLKSFGIAEARLEPWGKFGRGWSYTRLSVQLKEPVEASLIGAPLAWCGGTTGPLAAEAILAPFDAKDEEGDPARIEQKIARFAETWRGKLHGKVVLLRKARDLPPPSEPAAKKLDEKDLASRAQAPDPEPAVPVDLPITKVPEDPKERGRYLASAPSEAVVEYWEKLRQARRKLHVFLKEEGAAAVLTTDDRGDGGIIFAEAAGAWETDAPAPAPTVVLIPEHYNRLARLVEKGIRTVVEIDLAARFQDDSLEGMNVIAEIPGGRRKEEVVMLGGHLDSWHSGTGTTDNAAGCAVALEAARILVSLKLPLDRTVRLALWGGEEQGLIGSRAWVKSHLGDPRTMKLTPEHERFSCYFNLDNGAGKIRGIHLQGNDMARPIFEAWLAPFRDMGAATVAIRNTGGTDHLSFDAVGLPGFQFIQDPVDYGSRTHHSNLDVYDRAQASDMVQASMVLAAFVYQAANREEMLPRKALPTALETPASLK